MSDSYQAVYDAVRSRFHVGDVSSVIEEVVRNAFSGVQHQVACVAQEYSTAAYEQQRPSAIYRPAISIDGNQWCALYGDNLQDGVCGFGDTPAKAMADFDSAWHRQTIRGAA